VVYQIHFVRKRFLFIIKSSFILSSSLYQQFHLEDGFQGCIHELSINDRRLTFNNPEHHTILSAQNIGL
jgi:hypothetical protein